jgi:hypothetical protein
VVSASCGIGRGTIHHRLQAHWIASRRCSPGSCAAVSGRSSTHRIPEPRACTTCRLVFSIQGRRAVCNISCKRRRFFQSLHSFAVSGLGLGPFDSLNMLLRSRVDDYPRAAMKWARHPNLRKRPGRASTFEVQPCGFLGGRLCTSSGHKPSISSRIGTLSACP